MQRLNSILDGLKLFPQLHGKVAQRLQEVLRAAKIAERESIADDTCRDIAGMVFGYKKSMPDHIWKQTLMADRVNRLSEVLPIKLRRFLEINYTNDGCMIIMFQNIIIRITFDWCSVDFRDDIDDTDDTNVVSDSVLQAIRRSVKPGRNLNIRKLADALVVAYNATVANEADHMTMRFIWKREKRRHNIEKKWSQVVKAASKIDGELADIAADAVAMILPM
jgi:hypothetical protein